ncbi:mitochondrial carrier [Basidiobolus meristosporus CBS 931.73]|uniref:Mitochondrial carrier n=1 Tax=Basidiobolus meristosporus CBS 931.73 TaxID=1314790 RepID=A0A1Y1YC62_9FUNG|nr:mitochondrial carrier [Basidiobolus meristosporus CBS 931.73]|eukprot:ORX95567.1 mitochondrial carrier [Basidiobolus meristosporus CBS 931.73]
MSAEVENSQFNPNEGSSWKSFVAGGAGGVCLVLAGHPFDLIKVRLQTVASQQSTFSLAKTILIKEGPRGLYRGVVPPIIGSTPIFATAFWGYDLGLRIMRYSTGMPANTPKDKMELWKIAVAGAFSAIPTTVLLGPAERVKVMLQVQGLNGEKSLGTTEIVRKIYREGGIRSVFRGTWATLIRDAPGSAVYFGVYEYLKRVATPTEPGKEVSALSILTAGGVAGIASWLFMIPIDTVKSRLQTAKEGAHSGMVDVFKHLIRTEGYLGLYRGIFPVLLRAFPANAACFGGMEATLKILNSLERI